MKNILYLLILISSTGWGQGLAVTVFIPGQGWVSKNIYDTNNPPTSITNPTLTNSTLAGTLAAPAGVITNAMLAGNIAYSKLSLTGAILNADLAGSIAESKITNLTTDLAAKMGVSVAATTATTGTMTTTMTSATQNVFTITPTGACTFNASGGTPGAEMTNFKTTATLSTGTTTAKTFVVHFICKSATEWDEVSRTTAM